MHPSQGQQEKVRIFLLTLRMPRLISVRKGVNVLTRDIFHIKFNTNINFHFLFLNNIEVFEKPVYWTKKIPHCVVDFEVGEENRIVREIDTVMGT